MLQVNKKPIVKEPIKRFKNRCRICRVGVNNGKICHDCVDIEKLEQEIAAREKAHAEKYKCEKCNKGLSLKYRRICGDCRNTHWVKRIVFDEDFLYHDISIDTDETEAA
jgi:hypothetical protein